MVALLTFKFLHRTQPTSFNFIGKQVTLAIIITTTTKRTYNYLHLWKDSPSIHAYYYYIVKIDAVDDDDEFK